MKPTLPEPLRRLLSGKIIRNVAIACGGVTLVGGAFLLYVALTLPPLREIEDPQSRLSSQVLSADGEILDNFFTEENRIPVALHEISPYVIHALVATEDVRFYGHSGIDPYSVLAVFKRFVSGTTSGASTITMQLARNLFDAVGKERSLLRKMKEMVTAMILERKFTKEEIITSYLNTVSIYGNTYGIEMASRRLFGKSADELTIEESATLVAMLKGQGVYDPVRRKERVQKRRNFVIEKMVQNGVLNPDSVSIDSVKAIAVTTIPQELDHVRGIAPYFRQAVREFVMDWCRKNPRQDGSLYDLYGDGLRIYTTLDSRIQAYAEQAASRHMKEMQGIFDKHLYQREPWLKEPAILTDLMKQSDRYMNARRAGMGETEINRLFEQPIPMRIFSWNGERDTVLSPMDSIRYYSRFLETGFVAIDPTNGHVKAWLGGINFKYFKYDHVATGKRQVGSTFKPFVYAAAIERGWKPCDQILNQPVFFDNPTGGPMWSPKNADGKIGGKMTLQQGLATSTNMITAYLMKKVGPNTVARAAHTMGIQSPLDPVPSLCLGTTDLSVLELTGAYGTFANGGIWNEPIFVTRIEDKSGNVIAEFFPETRKALRQDVAYTMMNLLQGVVDQPGGTAGRLRYRFGIRQPVGAKTGTTQNHSDGWFVGVTPNLMAGVWVGCSDRRMRFRTIEYGQGAALALPIWAYFMKAVYSDKEIGLPQEGFKRPSGYQDPTCGSTAEGETGSDQVPLNSDDLDGFN
jgi:penicillin-binding protein 1A